MSARPRGAARGVGGRRPALERQPLVGTGPRTVTLFPLPAEKKMLSSASAAGTQQIYSQGSPFPAGHSGKAFRYVPGGTGAEAAPWPGSPVSAGLCAVPGRCLQALGWAEDPGDSGSALHPPWVATDRYTASVTLSDARGAGRRASSGDLDGSELPTPDEGSGGAPSSASQRPQPCPRKRGRRGPSSWGVSLKRGSGTGGLASGASVAHRGGPGDTPEAKPGPRTRPGNGRVDWGGPRGLSRVQETALTS